MSVPASSERFLAKARDLPVDEVMLDLEDSVAPDAKPAARELAVAALRAGGLGREARRGAGQRRDDPLGLPGRHRGHGRRTRRRRHADLA
jgi:hypothetical protein